MRYVRGEDGQALVETAFSLSLFVVMVLGVVEFGRLAFSAIEVSNAAAAAAQYATQTPQTAENLTNMLAAAQNEYYNPSDISLVSPTATTGYACNCAGSGTSVSCSSNSISSPPCPGSYVEVTITFETQATYTPAIHIPGLSTSFQLHGIATRKVLQ
jgi:Flp pilus assembly protein TadG